MTFTGRLPRLGAARRRLRRHPREPSVSWDWGAGRRKRASDAATGGSSADAGGEGGEKKLSKNALKKLAKGKVRLRREFERSKLHLLVWFGLCLCFLSEQLCMCSFISSSCGFLHIIRGAHFLRDTIKISLSLAAHRSICVSDMFKSILVVCSYLLSFDARQLKCAVCLLKCALARRPPIQMRLLYVQACSLLTPVNQIALWVY